MGHNRAGDRRKARAKRRKKQEARHDKWIKEWATKFATPVNKVYAVIQGDDIFYHYDKPKGHHIVFSLSKPMLFRNAVNDCEKKLYSMENIIKEHYPLNTDR